MIDIKSIAAASGVEIESHSLATLYQFNHSKQQGSLSRREYLNCLSFSVTFPRIFKVVEHTEIRL